MKIFYKKRYLKLKKELQVITKRNEELRKSFKNNYNHNFSKKDYNMVIVKFPFTDVFGFPIITHQYNTKSKKKKLQMKYMNLKFVEATCKEKKE
jgi:hypothetical protein